MYPISIDAAGVRLHYPFKTSPSSPDAKRISAGWTRTLKPQPVPPTQFPIPRLRVPQPCRAMLRFRCFQRLGIMLGRECPVVHDVVLMAERQHRKVYLASPEPKPINSPRWARVNTAS